MKQLKNINEKNILLELSSELSISIDNILAIIDVENLKDHSWYENKNICSGISFYDFSATG